MRYIRINPADNVAVALADLKAGEDVYGVTLTGDVPAGHKIALRPVPEGGEVIKYGFPIGHLICPVAAGSVIDHKCLRTALEGMLEYEYNPVPTSMTRVNDGRTFRGFVRGDGQVGVRNQIWIIPTVGCVNGIAESLASAFSKEISSCMGAVDAVLAFPHNLGCSQLGGDHENTRRILRDMVLHPNAGGVLLVSLGCENNQLDSLMDFIGPVDGDRVKSMIVQNVEGDETEYGLSLLREIFSVVSKDSRSDVPVSELKLGLKCGGSDGLSGITANPLLGEFSDWIVSRGGTTVLTEVPEMFGAETILMGRCRDRAVFEKTVGLINDFKSYFIDNGQPVYENPSPGNKAGGISTLEEKSLGCTQKSGSSRVEDVLSYGERLSAHGLNLLSAPGNDLVASTALAAAGCQMVLFTTGRGTPFGSFVPTMKISTNSRLAAQKPSWIDFDAGVLVDGEPMDTLVRRFADYVLEVASGKLLNNEINGWRGIAIFKTGVTL